MNKFGIFAVTLICLLFVDIASSIRVSESLAARLAVRKRQLQVEDAEARKETQSSSPSSKSDVELKARIKLAIDQLHAAELQVVIIMREAKQRAEEEAVQQVKDAIKAQIAIMRKEQDDKEKAERAARAAERVLNDPATLGEIALALQKRIEEEIIRAAHEERVEKQVSKELQNNLIREAERAHNQSIKAQADAAKNVANALKEVQEQYVKAEKAQREVSKKLKEGVKDAINSAESKYEKLMSSAPAKKAAPAAPAAQPQPGLIQMTNLKKLKQQLKK